MRIFYKPENAVLGDMIPFFDESDNLFKPFYLRNYRCLRLQGYRDTWVMLTTNDHVHFTEHDTGITGGTGSVIKVDGIYHMFYCTFQVQPERNYINHAISRDLMTWTPIPEDTFHSDNTIYASVHWRDPFVFWNGKEQLWWMILAAQKIGTTTRRACVGLCKSKDLRRWVYCEPLYAPADAQCAFECPDLFKWGDWYYLVFSSYADRFQTLYRMSRSLEGPWLTPDIDTFDTRAFYAAKTGTDGKRRFIYGWNPTRELGEHHFNPQCHEGQDCNEWDWGGNLIVHELKQEEDATLSVMPVREILNAFGSQQPIVMRPLCGNWSVNDNSCTANAPYSYASLLLNSIPETCRLSMDVKLLTDTAQLGIALHVDEQFAEGYYAIIDPFRRRLEYKTSVRMSERGGQKFPYEVEMERPLSPFTNDSFHMDILVDGSILVVYVDNRIALGTRMFDRQGYNFGLFVSEGKACFSDIKFFCEQ